jgi:hypothetical protein
VLDKQQRQRGGASVSGGAGSIPLSHPHFRYCYLLVQAIFKESRETLLRIGAMRFVDSLVTARPMPPARALRVTNDAYSLAFRFGVDDEHLTSPEERSSSIAPLRVLQTDARDADGKLGVFQSTPSGSTAPHTL